MNLILAVLAFTFVAIGSTKLIFPRRHSDGSFAAIPSRMLIGVALVVCLMNNISYVLPGRSSAWVVFGLMLFLSLIAGW